MTKEADSTTKASNDSNDSKEAVRTTEANRYQNRLTLNQVCEVCTAPYLRTTHNIKTLGTTRGEVPLVTSTIYDQVCDRTVARVLLDAPLLRAWLMIWEL